MSECKILVVDDVEQNRNLVRRRFERLGFIVREAESGAEALHMMQETMPDVLLLDYMMPNMSGIEVLHVIRDEWKIADLPIIMLTARAEGEAVAEALQAGADDYVTKPIDFDALRARIDTQLQKHSSHERLLKSHESRDEEALVSSLALEEMREELNHEISKRKIAEEQLEAIRSSERSKAGLDHARVVLDDAKVMLEQAIENAVKANVVNAAELMSILATLNRADEELRRAG